MDSITSIAKGLSGAASGIYTNKYDQPVSYPENGNEFCYALEEKSFWFKHRNDAIITLLARFPPYGTLYDIGGGNGFVSKTLCDHGIDTVLIEPGNLGVKFAKKRGVKRIIKSTFEACKFRQSTLPAVGLFDVIEHIDDDIKFLSKIRHALQPGGRLYLTAPAYPWLWSVEDTFARHFRRYTVLSIRSALEQAGFRVEYKTYIFAALPVPIFFFRTLPSLLHFRSSSFYGNRKDHQIPAVLSILNRFYSRFELHLIKSAFIPFGGSIMIVAKPDVK